MASTQTSQNIIKHWKDKWDIEMLDVNKFICYWIALNAWYGSNLFPTASNWKYPTEREYIDKIKWMLSQDTSTGWDTEIQWAQSLVPGLKNTTRENIEISVSDIPTLVEFIYTVRNNLFHWHKTDTDDRDRQVLKIATPILHKIFTTLSRYVSNN